MNYNNISIENKNGIVYLKLNRPKVLNALNHETVYELDQAFKKLSLDRSIIGVIITGEGRAFAAGADITEITKVEEGESSNLTERFYDYLGQIRQTFGRIAKFPRPVIAAVNGHALGGGFELALNCDIIITSTKARFGLPEGKLGLVPSYSGTQLLPRIVGPNIAKELLFTGQQITAEEAKEIGITRYVVEPEKLLEKAEELIMTMANNAPIAIKYAKMAVNKGLDMPLDDALEFERAIGSLALATNDAQEGIQAFIDKRTPNFKNS